MSIENAAAYIVQVEAWRSQRETDLRAPDGWLALTGLFILKDGYHTVGSNPASNIVLPASAPDHVGVLEFRKGKAIFSTAAPSDGFGGHVLVDGLPIRRIELVDNRDRKKPTSVTVGTVSFFLHNFGDQYAIRVKDSANPTIADFSGCKWFEVKPEYRVQGKFNPYEAPHTIPIKTIIDTNTSYKSVGTVNFTLQGHNLHLLATDTGQPNQLSVIFRDATSGKQTYGPARFLTVEIDAAGNALLDFNKAINPPCAFSPYATCPLPPRENILSVAIEAGERYTSVREPLRSAAPVTAAAEDVRSEDSEQLIRELSAELAALYQVSDGSAGFTPSDVEVPRAAFVVARINGYPVGCGALRPLDQTTVEVKRMYTRPEYRRQGVAQAILAELERLSVNFGYSTIKLQTGPKQLNAAALYELVGYYRIPRFSGNWELVLAYQKDLVQKDLVQKDLVQKDLVQKDLVDVSSLVQHNHELKEFA